MNEKEVLSQASDTILQEPVTLTVDVRPTGTIHRLLQKWSLQPAKRTFHVRPLTLGTLVRISKLLLAIDVKSVDDLKALGANYQLMGGHGKAIAEIIALAVTNTKARPAKSLIDFFLHNLTPQELVAVLLIVVKQMDIQSFSLTIVLILGLQIQKETSPKDPKEIIAFGGLSAE